MQNKLPSFFFRHIHIAGRTIPMSFLVPGGLVVILAVVGMALGPGKLLMSRTYNHGARAFSSVPLVEVVTPTVTGNPVGLPPTATPSGSPNATPTPTAVTIFTPPTPTHVPGSPPTATATAFPVPTATPVPPNCQVVSQGSVTLTPDQTYFDVDTGSISNTPSGEVAWQPATNQLVALSGSQFASLAGYSFSSITCSQLKGLSYTLPTAPVMNGLIFAVNTPASHVAAIQISTNPGAPQPTFTWVTYN